ncbi:tetratricopeptide repeat protein [Pararhodonellum marinum]|uniref:tetratricopeptide repeat protein n=1 Tax=Pararhodonellum marinum TaxID=2755358 RepID=UPI00188E8058|nr:tetratricopeptide repeat protein [Pararhodonellum marinum]
MAKKVTRAKKAQVEKGNELLENPEEIADRLQRGELFIKKNSKIVGGAIIALILVIAGILYFQIDRQNKNKTAQAEMFQAVYYYEQDSLEFAINGDGSNPGFLDIINRYKGTDAANLSHYYLGSIYLSEREFQKAVDHLEKFSSDDYFVQAKAYALIGDAYFELKNIDKAISNYDKAAKYRPNKFFTPRYLMKLAVAYEEAGQLNKAIEAYGRIEQEYFESYEFTAARKHKARLEGLASN